MIIKNKNSKSSLNLGIELLRFFMCFWVILYHCFETNNIKIKKIIIFKRFHVPTFMFISFYYFYNNLNSRNIRKIKMRLIRNSIPYIIYPSIIWIFNNIQYLIFQSNRFKRKLTLIELIYQLAFGIKIYGIIWFNNILLLFILFFTLISLLFKTNFLLIFLIISILVYAFDYSNYTPIITKSYTWIFLGRVLGMFPISVTGLFLSSINIISKLKIDKYRNKAILICFLNILFLFKYDIFIIKRGYVYRSILFNIAAINFFIFFSLIPLEKITNKLVITFIKIITKYTGGIYYIHMIVKKKLDKQIDLINNKTVYGCIIIYLISYFICFIGITIFGKTIMRNLFC